MCKATEMYSLPFWRPEVCVLSEFSRKSPSLPPPNAGGSEGSVASSPRGCPCFYMAFSFLCVFSKDIVSGFRTHQKIQLGLSQDRVFNYNSADSVSNKAPFTASGTWMYLWGASPFVLLHTLVLPFIVNLEGLGMKETNLGHLDGSVG